MTKLYTKSALNTSNFEYDSRNRTMFGEASTLGFRGPYYLFDDACDYGVWMKSHRTGDLVPFELINTHSEDGDLYSWTLRSSKHNITAVIYND